MLKRCVSAAVFLSLLPVALVAGVSGQTESEAPRSAMNGVYSAGQASRGEQTYMNMCVACHPAGTYATPLFRTSWSGRPLSDLFDTVKEKMPKNDPGSLTPEEAAQVLAYLLKINEVPAGESELPSEVAALKRIKFETPGAGEGKAAR